MIQAGCRYRLWFRYLPGHGQPWQFRDMELPNLSEVRRVAGNVIRGFKHQRLQMGLEKIEPIWSYGKEIR